ncbi:MAG: hypothetical protein IIZ73_06895 [Ruminococcus sp.]|nr:hypothetical protein [Ruminococcus sp.]
MAAKIIKHNYERPDPTTNKNICRAYIVVDTEEELPAVDDFGGMILSQGSACYVIGTGNAYVLNSEGAWCNTSGEG